MSFNSCWPLVGVLTSASAAELSNLTLVVERILPCGATVKIVFMNELNITEFTNYI
jgi:hypothetical protein